MEIQAAGYHAVFSGQKAYNGVAWLSRQEPEEPLTQVSGIDNSQKRLIAVTIDGVRLINLYVINGKEPGTENYRMKLEWLRAVGDFIAEELKRYPYLLLSGDFNIAPGDDDVHNPEKWRDCILCSEPEREALNRLLKLGLIDTFRLFDHPDDGRFSWWHYTKGSFERNSGLRIDLILASRALAEQCVASVIDRQPRGWDRPSDHAPALATFKTPPP